MSAVRVGTEIVDCGRIGKLILRHDESFLRRVFTPREIAHCSRRAHAIQHYAARYAAKVALAKVLQVHPLVDNRWIEIEIRGSLRRPLSVAVGGTLRHECVRQRISAWSASASFTRAFATATVVALCSE